MATKAGILRCQAPNIYRIDNNSQRRVRASAPFGPSIEPNRHMQPLTPPSTHQCTHINQSWQYIPKAEDSVLGVVEDRGAEHYRVNIFGR